MDRTKTLKIEFIKNEKIIPQLLAKFKYRIRTDFKVSTVIDKIYNKQLLGNKYIYKGLCAKSNEQINSTAYIPFVEKNTIIHEFCWAYEIIKRYADILNIYNDLKSQYEKELLKGEYDNAAKINDNIKDKVTYSLWGIENDFVIKQLKGGFEENRKYLSQISEQSINYFVTVLVDFYSAKADTENSYDGLEYRLENFLDHIKEDSFYFDVTSRYLRYKLLFCDNDFDINAYTQILSFESTMSIIDYYNTFIDVLVNCISRNLLSEEELNIICLNLRKLTIIIKDKRIDHILQIIDEDYEIEIDSGCIHAQLIDFYTLGNYKKCLEIIDEVHNETCDDFDVMEIKAKCLLFENFSIEKQLNDSNLYDYIVSNMMNIFTCKNKKQSFDNFRDIYKIISNLIVSKRFEYFLYSQLTSENLLFRRKIDFINSLVITPRMTFIFSKERQQNILNINYENKQFLKTIDFINNYLNGGVAIDNEIVVSKLRGKYYFAKSLAVKSIEESIYQFENFYKELDKINSEESRYYYERTAKELFGLHMKNKSYDKAIHILSNAYLKDKDYIIRMDIAKLNNELEEISEDIINIYSKDISWPIFQYAMNPKDSSNIYINLFNFLDKNEVVNPMDIANENHFLFKANRKEMIFILEKMFIYEIMKKHVYFDLTQRFEFRVYVLEFLSKIIPDRKNLYAIELNEIMYEQGILDKMKTIDTKKIYVDVRRIIAEHEDIFRKKFRRFLSLKNMDITLNCSDIYGFESITIQVDKSPEIDQKYALLKEMVIEFNREFLYNPNHGLDKFLSSRIRHGVLPNNLFKPFNNSHLMSTIDSDGKFSINHYWDDKFPINPSEKNGERICNLLNTFSEKVFFLINECKNWMSITSKEYPNGMLDFQEWTNKELYLITIDLEQQVDYEMFYQTLANVLWSYTEVLLESIRSRIQNELKESFNLALIQLEVGVGEERKNHENEEICKLIQNKIVECKSKLKGDIEYVANWFYIRKDNECEDYYLKEPIEIVIKANKKINSDYKLISTYVNVPEIRLKGESFMNFWDIINILYSNAIKHSGFIDCSKIEISINSEIATYNDLNELISLDEKLNSNTKMNKSIKEKYLNKDSKILYIEVKNNLESNFDKDKLKAIIAEKFDLMDAEEHKKLIVKEGGTGLIKLSSILKNMGSNPIIAYEIIDNVISFGIYLEISGVLI